MFNNTQLYSLLLHCLHCRITFNSLVLSVQVNNYPGIPGYNDLQSVLPLSHDRLYTKNNYIFCMAILTVQNEQLNTPALFMFIKQQV